jgi:hypothetical protein
MCLVRRYKEPMGRELPNEDLNQTGALRQRLARNAREPHLFGCARWFNSGALDCHIM